jgi:hypothetical protein
LKDKEHKKQVLQSLLPKYCKQLGIVDCEIPYLTFNGVEFRELNNEATQRLGYKYSRAGGEYTSVYGYCSLLRRLIFLNLHTRNRDLRELRKCLVHELVHYRFPSLNHGREFHERIDKVLRGKSYPMKHISRPYLRMI